MRKSELPAVHDKRLVGKYFSAGRMHGHENVKADMQSAPSPFDEGRF